MRAVVVDMNALVGNCGGQRTARPTAAPIISGNWYKECIGWQGALLRRRFGRLTP